MATTWSFELLVSVGQKARKRVAVQAGTDPHEIVALLMHWIRSEIQGYSGMPSFNYGDKYYNSNLTRHDN